MKNCKFVVDSVTCLVVVISQVIQRILNQPVASGEPVGVLSELAIMGMSSVSDSLLRNLTDAENQIQM